MISHHYTLLDNMNEREFKEIMDKLFGSTGIPKRYFDLPFDPIKPEKSIKAHSFIKKDFSSIIPGKDNTFCHLR
jgi:hypothetical protein